MVGARLIRDVGWDGMGYFFDSLGDCLVSLHTMLCVVTHFCHPGQSERRHLVGGHSGVHAWSSDRPPAEHAGLYPQAPTVPGRLTVALSLLIHLITLLSPCPSFAIMPTPTPTPELFYCFFLLFFCLSSFLLLLLPGD